MLTRQAYWIRKVQGFLLPLVVLLLSSVLLAVHLLGRLHLQLGLLVLLQPLKQIV